MGAKKDAKNFLFSTQTPRFHPTFCPFNIIIMTMAEDSDIPKKSLVEKARTDPQTFAYLFDLHYDEIFRFHSRWLHDRAIAEEATSEVFLTTAKNFHRFEGDLRDYRNWLYKIAADQAAPHLRSTGESEEPQVQTATKTAILKKALTKLKPKVQAIIALRLFENMEYQQIAIILKLDRTAVRSRLTAAVAKLRESLADLQTDQTEKRAITSGRDDEAAIRDFLSEVKFDDHPNRAYAENLRQKLITEYQRCLLEPIPQPTMMLQKTFIAVAVVTVVITVTIYVISILKISNGEQAPDQTIRRDLPTTKIEQTESSDKKRETNLFITRFNAIIQMKNEGDIAGLLNMLNDENQMLSTIAATLLAEIGDIETLDTLLTMIDSDDLAGRQTHAVIAAEKLRARLTEQGILEPEPDTDLTVYGTATDPNGKPITATIIFGKQKPAHTNQFGEYEIVFPDITSMEKPNVCFAYNMDRQLGRTFYWQRTDEPNDIDISLLPMAAIIGRFVDQYDIPIPPPGLEILIGSLDTNENPIWKTTLYDNGRFIIEMVPTGLPIILKQPTTDGDFTMTAIKNLKPAEIRNLGDIIIDIVEEEPPQTENADPNS